MKFIIARRSLFLAGQDYHVAEAEGRNTLSPAYATHKSCLTCASCTQKIIASTRCDRWNDLVELSVDFVALLLLDQLLASLSLSLACSLSLSHTRVCQHLNVDYTIFARRLIFRL